MTDIVERLRDLQAEFYGDECLRSDLKKAADEVERLREEIEFWKNADSATKEMSEELKRSLFAEIERLRSELSVIHEINANANAEIERLLAVVTKWKARAQVMRDYLTRYSGPSTTLWRDFCRVRPEAREWFYGDGAPR